MKDMTIKVKEKSARERVDKLNQLKHDRMKRFKRLTEMEVALCKGLDEKSQLTPYWQAQRLPSEEELQEYRDRIDHLSTIKVSTSLKMCVRGMWLAQQAWISSPGSAAGGIPERPYKSTTDLGGAGVDTSGRDWQGFS